MDSKPFLCFHLGLLYRDKRNLPFTPILASVNRLIRYHLGTVAKGSFIITLVKIPRMILMYIHSQLKGKVRKNPFLDFLWANSRTSVLHVAKFPAILSPSANVFFSPCLVESNSSLLSPTLALCSFPKCLVLLFLCVD